MEVDHVAAQDRDFLGVASGPRELHSAHRGGDSLARAEGSGRVRDDLAGGFDARHRRAVDGGHHAGPAIYLGPIEPEGTDADLHLVRLGLWRRNVGERENLGATNVFDDPGFHFRSPHLRGRLVEKR